MRITEVKYIRNYILEITFYNRVVKRVNLREFLTKALNPMTTKYRRISLFKKVRIENGYLTWGDNEMDLSGESLYNWDDPKPKTIKRKRFTH